MQATTVEEELLLDLASYEHRPFDFAIWAFPWGERGSELERRRGLETWQGELLRKLQAALLDQEITVQEAIQIAVKSGHDIGKSALVCILILWAVATREDTKGVVTANTEKQLRLKLWAELAKWHRLFIAKQFFRLTATSIQSVDPEREKEWRIDAIPWSEDNPEAFAGLHNFGKRIIVIFDEASGIVNKIWETIDGVMNETETELIWVATGNPTRNIGRFRECFDPAGQGQFWQTLSVDSREVSFTNKERIERQIALWGIDSDYIKVRWLGEFPSQGANQLIDSASIRAAQLRELPQPFEHEPLIMSVDVARFGNNKSVIRFRRGRDARTIPAKKFRGLSTTALGQEVVSCINQFQPDAVFIDEGGIGGGVIDFVRFLGHACIGVNFGGTANWIASGEKAYNKRAEMYLSARAWLALGCIDDDEELATELESIEYFFAKGKINNGSIMLVPKEEMDESPDDADAFVMSFAFPVASRMNRRAGAQMKSDYNPFSFEAFNEPQSEVRH